MNNKLWPFESHSITEAMINGEVKIYHGCTSKSLEEGKAFYKEENGWEYIGCGYIYSVNGTKQDFPPNDNMHFFVLQKKEKVPHEIMTIKEFALQYFQQDNEDLLPLVSVEQWLEFTNQYHLQKVEESYKKAHDFVQTDTELNYPDEFSLCLESATKAIKIASGITPEHLAVLPKEYQ